MSSDNITRLVDAYSIAPVEQGPLFSTLGDTGPTALNQSEFAIGQQQRANNLYAETTFVCPSYWLANSYTTPRQEVKRGSSQGRAAWKYQFSVPPSEHGADLDAYQAFNREALGEGTMTTAARRAIQLAWGRFIIYGTFCSPARVWEKAIESRNTVSASLCLTILLFLDVLTNNNLTDNPTLPDNVVLALTTNTNGTSTGDNITAISSSNWPQWAFYTPVGVSPMLNVNMTGGVPDVISWTPVDGTAINITQMVAPGLEAAFRIVDANSWEGGRTLRCELWREFGEVVPE